MYAVLRHEKLKSTSKGAAGSHNHREGEPPKPTVNPQFRNAKTHRPANINPDLTHLNKSMFKGGSRGMVDRILNRIPVKRRKDAVEAVELILSASPEFFDSISENRASLIKASQFKRWAEETVKWAKKEFGENLVDCVLHMDEDSPHFHIIATPLTKDGRLCGKEFLSKIELIRRQTDYAKAMSPFNLKRGLSADVTNRKHTSLKDDRRQKSKAQAEILAMPELPRREGMLDLKYVQKLEDFAIEQNALLKKMLNERHRVLKLELELSKSIHRLPDAEKSIEILRAEKSDLAKTVGELITKNALLEKELLAAKSQSVILQAANNALKNEVADLKEQLNPLPQVSPESRIQPH
jgi:hypothetical protein